MQGARVHSGGMNMQGLELCRRFFFEVGLPEIQKQLPELLPHLAAGLSGGSQCHGNDDEQSRDHDWGPGFIVWLDDVAFHRFNQPLRAMLDTLPQEYLGYGWQKVTAAQKSCTIAEIKAFMRAKIGVVRRPDDDATWLMIPEEQLFELSHTAIFYDAPAEITNRIQSFANYPEEIWKNRMVKALRELWQWKVRHIERAMKRKDVITAQLLWGKFCEHAMKAGFLLNHEYAPYDKWRYVQFLKLPEFGQEVGTWISAGLNDANQMVDAAQKIQSLYTQKLYAMGFTPAEMPDSGYEDMELQAYAVAIYTTIQNSEIRADLALSPFGRRSIPAN